MAWEPIEKWPGLKTYDSFREASEPLEAERASRSLSERLRGFLGSTDEERAAHLVDRIALTANYVYIKRADGTLVRTPISSLIAQQSIGPVIRYGVKGGEDFLLYARAGCKVQDALSSRLGRSGDPVTYDNVVLALFVACLVTPFTFFIFLQLKFFDLPHLFATGQYVSEGARWLYTALALLVATLLLWLWLPFRMRVDTLGLHISRGVFPWLKWHVPVDELEVEQMFENAVIMFRTPRRFGTLRKRRKVLLDRRHADRRTAEDALREPRRS